MQDMDKPQDEGWTRTWAGLFGAGDRETDCRRRQKFNTFYVQPVLGPPKTLDSPAPPLLPPLERAKDLREATRDGSRVALVASLGILYSTRLLAAAGGSSAPGAWQLAPTLTVSLFFLLLQLAQCLSAAGLATTRCGEASMCCSGTSGIYSRPLPLLFLLHSRWQVKMQDETSACNIALLACQHHSAPAQGSAAMRRAS